MVHHQILEEVPGSHLWYKFGSHKGQKGPLLVQPFLEEVLTLRSISWHSKRKLMAFSCLILLSSVPPQCVMLWWSPDMIFSRNYRVVKLLGYGPCLFGGQNGTYCNPAQQSVCKTHHQRALNTDIILKLWEVIHCVTKTFNRNTWQHTQISNLMRSQYQCTSHTDPLSNTYL